MKIEKRNKQKCCWKKKCKKKARWEVGFTEIIHDAFMFEGSGENEFQQLFCDRHFRKLNGCGNVVEFRLIGREKWVSFDDYDNHFLLKELVKKSYKLSISDKLKFKKITNYH
jgi:hypothetical protein